MDWLHRFSAAWPRLSALLLGCGLAALCLGVVEGAARWLEPPSPLVRQQPRGLVERDARGRTHPAAPGAYRASAALRESGEVVYDVVYAVDEHLRRITPLPDGGPRSRFALFFGGSYTWGEGVDAAETLPARFARQAPRYRPYNYGFPGHGPAEMLTRLEEGDLPAEVEEREGVLVYTFIEPHVRRTVGPMSLIAGWGHKKPYYAPTDDGGVEWRGTFASGRPLRSFLYRLLGGFELVDRLGIDWPPRLDERHVETTARVVARSRELFEEQFPGSRFVFVAYPGSARAEGQELMARLVARDVEVVDLNDVFDPYTEPGFQLSPHDAHPSAEAYRRTARALAERLAAGSPGVESTAQAL